MLKLMEKHRDMRFVIAPEFRRALVIRQMRVLDMKVLSKSKSAFGLCLSRGPKTLLHSSLPTLPNSSLAIAPTIAPGTPAIPQPIAAPAAGRCYLCAFFYDLAGVWMFFWHGAARFE
jgi:hypothetical protein